MVTLEPMCGLLAGGEGRKKSPKKRGKKKKKEGGRHTGIEGVVDASYPRDLLLEKAFGKRKGKKNGGLTSFYYLWGDGDGKGKGRRKATLVTMPHPERKSIRGGKEKKKKRRPGCSLIFWSPTSTVISDKRTREGEGG